MDKKKIIFQTALAYIAWAISILLFLWFMISSRETWLAFLRNYWAQESFSRQMAISFLDRAFMITLGIAWVVLMIVVESYFRNGVVKNNLYQRLGKVIGLELIGIFISDFLMFLMLNFQFISWIRWMTLGLTFTIGVILIWVGWFSKKPKLTTKAV